MVRLGDGSQTALPGWMLDPDACSCVRMAAKPAISLDALLALRRLLDAQPLLVSTNSSRISSPGSLSAEAKHEPQQGQAASAALGERVALGAVPRDDEEPLSGASRATPEGDTGDLQQRGGRR